MPFAHLNGLQIHYELFGDVGEPIVFVHGYTGSSGDWVHQIERFSGAHRVLVFDNRGHGESEACTDPGGHSVDAMTADALQLIDRVGFERFHLVGHSIGGAVAQEIARRAPERLLSLTLEDTTDWFGDHDEPGGTPPYASPEEMRLAAERVAKMSRRVLAEGWKGLLEWRGSREWAHEIEVPTLIVLGDRDASRILEGSRRLRERIPGAEYVEIEGAGHSPQRECPEAFNDALGRFLRDHAGR